MRKLNIGIFIVLAIIIVLFGTRSVWRAYYNQSLHKTELILPNAAGDKDSIEFSLPRGKYIIKAEIDGELLNKDLPRRIRYKVASSKQGLIIEHEAKINFSNRVRQVWLKSFEIKDKICQGIFSVEMIKPGKPLDKGKIFIIREILFRTVE